MKTREAVTALDQFRALVRKKGKPATEFPIDRFVTRSARGSLGGLAVVCMCLAAAEAIAQSKDKETPFEEFAGSYKGTMTLSQPPSTSASGPVAGRLDAARNGDGGELDLRGKLILGAETATVTRNMKFSRRTFRSTSSLITSSSSALGRGRGRYSFKGKLLRYTDNTVFQSSGSTIPVPMKGTARFSPRLVRITEIWNISGSEATFTYKMKRKR